MFRANDRSCDARIVYSYLMLSALHCIILSRTFLSYAGKHLSCFGGNELKFLMRHTFNMPGSIDNCTSFFYNGMKEENKIWTIRLQSGDYSCYVGRNFLFEYKWSVDHSAFVYLFSKYSIEWFDLWHNSVECRRRSVCFVENVSKFVRCEYVPYKCHSKDSQAIDGKEATGSHQRFTRGTERDFIEEYGGNNLRTEANKIGKGWHTWDDRTLFEHIAQATGRTKNIYK